MKAAYVFCARYFLDISPEVFSTFSVLPFVRMVKILFHFPIRE